MNYVSTSISVLFWFTPILHVTKWYIQVPRQNLSRTKHLLLFNNNLMICPRAKIPPLNEHDWKSLRSNIQLKPSLCILIGVYLLKCKKIYECLYFCHSSWTTDLCVCLFVCLFYFRIEKHRSFTNSCVHKDAGPSTYFVSIKCESPSRRFKTRFVEKVKCIQSLQIYCFSEHVFSGLKM